MSGKEVIAAMKKIGWVVDRIEGSHHIMEKGGISVTVPVHGNKDLPTGTLNAILKKSGLKQEANRL
jgi:predicted RNA binding protein YcfA (HicA-like mRNA interferase family)